MSIITALLTDKLRPTAFLKEPDDKIFVKIEKEILKN